MTNNAPITNLSGAVSSQAHFRLDIPEGTAKVVFTIAGSTSSSNDADLYVQGAAPPTMTAYLCRPYIIGSNETCAISSPTPGTYFVMLRGFTDYSGVTLTGAY